QYMITSSSDLIDDDTKFGDLKFAHMYSEDQLDVDKAIEGFKYVAKEAGIETLTEETPLKDILSKYDLYKDGSFVEGDKRISFSGYNGGRSFGEQIDAIVKYILSEKMTLEEVHDMFKTVNQIHTPIKERDAISGATIAFGGDFQKVVEIAMNGKLNEQVITDKTLDNNNILVEVLTQGYGGEIITDITFNEEGKVIDIDVKDSNESEDIGALLTEENSDFIESLIEGQYNLDEVETVSGATVTSNALIKAVNLAKEHFDTL
ncbi:MAG: FMN-binding protein, partial [Anaerococcus sp.]